MRRSLKNFRRDCFRVLSGEKCSGSKIFNLGSNNYLMKTGVKMKRERPSFHGLTTTKKKINQMDAALCVCEESAYLKESTKF